jgi:SPP1 gp7 family putative phage head morphogenesis protein
LKKYYFGDEKKDGGALCATERLMRTELARVQTEAQKQSFIKNGFEMYTFHTNTGCCDICAALNGKHFKIKDMQIGENAAPLHPHCRCSCSAYEDSAEYEEWLDFLANGGTTEEYNKLKAQPTATAKKEESKAVEQPATNDVTQFTKEQIEALEWYVSGEGMFINEYLRGRVGADFGELSSNEKELLNLMTEATDRALPKEIKTLYLSVDASAIFGNNIDLYELKDEVLYKSFSKAKGAYAQNKATEINKKINSVVGKTITEKGFMSTSKEYDVVAEWGDFTGSEVPIVLEFTVPAGAKGADLAKFDIEGEEQYEVLLARNTKYEIENIAAKDGNIYIKAKIKAE